MRASPAPSITGPESLNIAAAMAPGRIPASIMMTMPPREVPTKAARSTPRTVSAVATSRASVRAL
jgi:hypothetical protein